MVPGYWAVVDGSSEEDLGGDTVANSGVVG